VKQLYYSLDPTMGGWLIEFLYLCVSVSCLTLARKLASNNASASGEHRVWRAIAALFLALCISKQLGLETALTEAGRSLAFSEGWYNRRHNVQLAFIVLMTIACISAEIMLLMRVRKAPRPTLLALIGATFVVVYLMIRAISFHPVDHFIDQQIIGLRWNWILQMVGIGAVLLAREWRNKVIY
jgi:hypothetical protein